MYTKVWYIQDQGRKKTKKEGKIKYEQKRKGRIDREETHTQKKEIKKLVKKEEIEKREGIIKINKGRD